MNSGREMWRFDVRQDGPQASFHGDPLLTDSLIVIGSDRDSLAWVYAFEIATGRPRWKYPVGPGASSDVLQSGDRALFVTMSDSLVCAELGSGRRRWSMGTGAGSGDALTNAIAVSDGIVWFGGLDGNVRALEVETGRELWRRDVGGNVGSLGLSGPELFLATDAGRLLKLDGSDGAVLAESRVPVTAFRGPPASFGDSLLVFHGSQVILCVDRSLGHRWQQVPSDRWMTARAYLWGGLVLAADEAGWLHAFRVADGSAVWARRVGQAVRGLRPLSDALYAGTVKGMVHAIIPPGAGREAAAKRRASAGQKTRGAH